MKSRWLRLFRVRRKGVKETMKKGRIHVGLTAVTFFFGVMLVIQYTSIQDPVVLDTRDINQLREELKVSEGLHADLRKEITKTKEQLKSLEDGTDDEYEAVLQQNITKLEEEIGLSEITGRGLVITIEPMYDTDTTGMLAPYLTASLMSRFLNELKSLGAKEISVGNERIIPTSAVREVNGRMMLNHTPLPSFPIKVQLITEDPERMKSALDISYVQDDFALENLKITISRVNEEIRLPSYAKELHIKDMMPIEK